MVGLIIRKSAHLNFAMGAILRSYATAQTSIVTSLVKRSLHKSSLIKAIHSVQAHCSLTVSHKQWIFPTCGKTPSTIKLKWTLEQFLPCYCYAINTNDKAMRFQFHNLPLQQKERAWVNSMLISAWNQNSTNRLLCSVSVMPENKLSMQELNHLIGFKVLFWHWVFYKILVLSPNFQGGHMPVFPPADARDYYYNKRGLRTGNQIDS